MKLGFLPVCVAACIACFPLIGRCEEPEKVSACQIKGDPPAYNHKLVEVEAFLSQGFEDFTLFDPTCPNYPDIWLEYGGTARSGTMYCCGGSNERHRSQELVVE